ncbi:nucleotidyltransferase domain-containing protein [Candidatus Microgenomates bacterium]|nr:nucleotidyltransferase domain-containing protein [Candidatus Microgenomates bacterium]
MEHVRERTTKRVHVPTHWFLSLAYHDVFGYPLTRKELVRWATPRQEGAFPAEKTGGYYHMTGRAYLVLLRKEREAASFSKRAIAQHGVHVFSRIPTVRFVGITGSLAMGNADKESDIDLFIITSRGTLWVTRLLVRVVSLLSGIRLRRIGESEHKDTLCLNMWTDEANLSIPQDIHNIYTAHEVLQVVPLINKNQTFEKFLAANFWVEKYWVNTARFMNSKKNLKSYFLNLILKFLVVLEPLAYRLQLWHMKSRRTRELIEPGRAFFHPIDWGGIVLGEFERRTRGEDFHYQEARKTATP